MSRHLPSCCMLACEGCTDFARGERAATERIVKWLRGIGTAKMTHPSLRDWIMADGGLASSIERGEHKEATHE